VKPDHIDSHRTIKANYRLGKMKMFKGTISAFLATSIAHYATASSNDTYKSCELPMFEWAAYGTRLTGRMYTRRAAVLGDHLFAAGYLKSTGAPNNPGFVDVDDDFGVTGPYTTDDPIGEEGVSIVSDLISYTTEFGSYAQYEVGVVKINSVTGEPEDVYVYYGVGQDETCGLAARTHSNGEENMLAISGHFVGDLTAKHADGTKTTIINSNAEGGSDYVQHPNSVKNGFDDGFVIKANADNGDADWIVRHPVSNKDAQTVGVDLDNKGNVYGAGYKCNSANLDDSTVPTICDGFVAKFNKEDGSIDWEVEFDDLAAAMWLVYDEIDDALYVTGTTSHKGYFQSHDKDHILCDYETCGVTMRLSAKDGAIDWVRTVQGSPSWNFFSQSGDVRLAHEDDGPYIYVALDDAGEFGEVTLDTGSSYNGCLTDGTFEAEYDINNNRRVDEDDCKSGSTFVKNYLAPTGISGAVCGNGHENSDACIMKYHKYTGLPVWGIGVPPVSSIVPSPTGVTTVGYYYASYGYFDSVVLPNYNNVEGLYVAKIDADGKGDYVIHGGGTNKDRPYDAVADANGDILIVGYTQSEVINWGGSLTTKIVEEGMDQNDDTGTRFQVGVVGGKTSEYQFFALKLEASKRTKASCVNTCGKNGQSSDIQKNTCFIDNICYKKGETAQIFGRACLVCNPDKSQTEWSENQKIGKSQCFIAESCYEKDDPFVYRVSRRPITSKCQTCRPGSNPYSWSLTKGYSLDGNTCTTPQKSLPNDYVVPEFNNTNLAVCTQVQAVDACAGSCLYTEEEKGCRIGSSDTCGCTCDDSVVPLITLIPNCASEAEIFIEKEKNICDPSNIIDFLKIDAEECELKCRISNPRCTSYQTRKKSKHCFLFGKNGRARTNSDNKKFNCYLKKANTGFKKKKKMCNAKYFKSYKEQTTKENCEKKCTKSKDCEAYQFIKTKYDNGNNECLLFKKAETYKKNDLKKFTCNYIDVAPTVAPIESPPSKSPV